MLTRRQILLAPLLITGCGGRGEQRTRPLFAADTHPDEYPTVQALHAIDRLLDERTNGEMRVRIYAGGQMGAEKDTLEITAFGGLDLDRVNLAPLNSIVPETIVLALPFLFRSIAHSRAAFDGDVGRRILDAMSAYDLYGVCYYDSGARSFYNTKRPIRTPDDMHGLKIRVQNSDIYVAMVQALGANPTPIPYGEVYQALVQGVVDGAENNWPSYESTGHYEVAGYYSSTEHLIIPECFCVSKALWDGLSDGDKDIVKSAARRSAVTQRELWAKRSSASREKVIAAGVKFNEIADKAPFQAAMKPVYDKFIAENPDLEGLVKAIQAVD